MAFVVQFCSLRPMLHKDGLQFYAAHAVYAGFLKPHMLTKVDVWDNFMRSSEQRLTICHD